MRSRVFVLYALGAWLACGTCARGAHAQGGEASVWFRSAEGCPDGQQFVAQLAARGVAARLAGAGDPIDFVVTLGMGGQMGLASGTLERQSSAGTVALRSVADASCDAVAEALALTLALARSSDQAGAAPEGAPDTAQSEHAASAPATSAAGAEPVAVSAPASAVEVPVSAQRSAVPPHGSGVDRVALGAQATGSAGLSPSWMPGAGLHLSFLPAGALRAELRVQAFVGFDQGSLAGREYSLRVLGGRAEGCPVAVGEGLALRPCLALALGQLEAEGQGDGGRSTGKPWVTMAALARAYLELGSSVWLEVELDLVVPLLRHELFAGPGSEAQHRTAALGFQAGLGASVGLP